MDYKRALSPKGICVMAGGGRYTIPQMIFDTLLGLWISKTEGKKIDSILTNYNQKDIVALKKLFESGEIKSVIDRRYPLSETAEDLRYLGEGHAKGKVIIYVKHDK